LSHNTDWQIPVIVNIPHDGFDDEPVTIVYATELVRSLQKHLEKNQNSLQLEIKDWLAAELRGQDRSVPDWLATQLDELHQRISIVGCRSYRKDRLLRPFLSM
jgi:hypothetical protein